MNIQTQYVVAKSNTIEGDNSSPYTIGRKNVKNTIMLLVKDQNLVTLNSGTYSNNVGKLQCFLTVPCVGLSIGILSDPLVYHFIGSGSLKNVLLRKCIRLFMKIDKTVQNNMWCEHCLFIFNKCYRKAEHKNKTPGFTLALG